MKPPKLKLADLQQLMLTNAFSHATFTKGVFRVYRLDSSAPYGVSLAFEFTGKTCQLARNIVNELR